MLLTTKLSLSIGEKVPQNSEILKQRPLVAYWLGSGGVISCTEPRGNGSVGCGSDQEIIK